jgi:hypothetical protein
MKIIAVLLIILSAVLLLSEFDTECNNTFYILYILFLKIIGLLAGYIGINLFKKQTT